MSDDEEKPYKQPPPYNPHPPYNNYPQPHPPSNNNTVYVGGIGQPTVFLGGPLRVGPGPQPMTCPNCNMHITTRTNTSPNSSAYLLGAVLFCVGCVLCCCIPCCMSSFRDTMHYCPNCNHFIGKYRG